MAGVVHLPVYATGFRGDDIDSPEDMPAFPRCP